MPEDFRVSITDAPGADSVSDLLASPAADPDKIKIPPRRKRSRISHTGC